MKIRRAACVPLITHDPYFSVWSANDHLYDGDPVHWSGKRQAVRGYIQIGKVTYGFMGDTEGLPVIPQKEISVTATATEYIFENEQAALKVRFISPVLADDPVLASRPCTYLDFVVQRKADATVCIRLSVSDDLVSNERAELFSFQDSFPYHDNSRDSLKYDDPSASSHGGSDRIRYACMGKGRQGMLVGSGDNCTIDWGYVYLASSDEKAEIYGDLNNRNLIFEEYLTASEKTDRFTASAVIAYDDVCSIDYFGLPARGYWVRQYGTILNAIAGAVKDRQETLHRAAALDRQIETAARRAGGEDYAFLCNLSYRQVMAAHKLIADEDGNLIFLSKENDSNGCIGTVDVSYPSIPLFLLFNTELVKGMLRPIFRFAASDIWKFPFAPHDVGRYPYATGQRYGLKKPEKKHSYLEAEGTVFMPYYSFRGEQNIYDIRFQMPVEECGNMLIMVGAVCVREQSADFARPYIEQLTKWAQYLIKNGTDPGDQLCTDDFAGHLAHNVNLAAKSIMAIEAFSQILLLLDKKTEADVYHEQAKTMAVSWETRASDGDHYRLTFDKGGSWSLKYNIVWDTFFRSHLFPDKVFESEIRWYCGKNRKYGIPLDSRVSYTKSDWILWCASFAGTREEREKILHPVAEYLENTRTRFPFSDWYDTVTGEMCAFKGRSVQGGIFFPMLIDAMDESLQQAVP